MSGDIPAIPHDCRFDTSICRKTSGSRLDRLFVVFERQRRFRGFAILSIERGNFRDRGSATID